MEWKQLKRDYPNAYKVLEEFWERDAVKAQYCGMDWRELYDLFDEQGINCLVSNYPDGGGLNKWDWRIRIPAMSFRVISITYDSWTKIDSEVPENYDWFDTRQACERYVFERAFALLELRLTNAEPPESHAPGERL